MPLKARPHAAQGVRQTPQPDAASRLKYLRATVACAYAFGILLSQGLWFGFRRTIPRAPLLKLLSYSLSSHDSLFSGLLLAALALAAASRRPRLYLLAAAALTALLAVSDQTRLQP